MSEPFDKGSVDSSVISSTSEEGSRFQLSREMKILLGVLALGAAVGGWYVFSGAGTPTPDVSAASTPPAQTTPAAGQTAPPATPNTGAGTPKAGTPGAPVVGTPVVPGVVPSAGSGAGVQTTPATGVTTGTGPVTVPKVPFLNPQGRPEASTPDTSAAAQSGINPVDPLAAMPGSNPFQPLKVVDNNAPVAATAAAQAPQVSPQATSTATTPPQTIPSLSSGGAIPLPQVPLNGLSGSSAASGNTGNGGGVNLNGGAASTGSGATPSSGLGTGGAIPLPNVPLGGTPPRNSPATGAATAPIATTPPAASTPTTPPVPTPPPAPGSITPGLNAPSLGGLPLGGLALGGPGTAGPTAATGAATTPGTGSAAATLGAQSSVPLDSGNQPGVISQYGSANAPATPTVSPLDQLVQARSLVFNAVVLGPINTAIFKTAQGFVVVPTGQTLPDSTVTLKEVTATSATLSLGPDSKILELDKR